MPLILSLFGDIPLSEGSILLADEPHRFEFCVILLPSIALETQVLNSLISL
jgi:hypothetical protein